MSTALLRIFFSPLTALSFLTYLDGPYFLTYLDGSYFLQLFCTICCPRSQGARPVDEKLSADHNLGEMSVVCFRFLIGILPIQYPSTLLTKIMINLRTHELRPYHVALGGHLKVQGVRSRFVSFFKTIPLQIINIKTFFN